MGKLEKIKKALYRIYGLYFKEIRVLLKDKFAMLIIFALPVFLVLVLGEVFGGVGGNVESTSVESIAGGDTMEIPKIGLIDLDLSEGFPNLDLSTIFVNKCKTYESSGALIIVESNNQTELDMLLGTGVLNGYLIIPDMFEYNLSIHFPAIIIVTLDILDQTLLESTQSVIDTIIEDFKEENNFTGVFNYEITRANIPETGQTLFLGSPIFFPMVLFASAALTSAQLIVSDIPKDRMSLTPANKFEITLGKLLAMQTLMTILIVIMLVLSFFLGMTIRGSVLDFFWILFVIALSGVSFGLFVSAVARVPLEALQFFIFAFIFQIIGVLFVQDENILRFLPMFDGYKIVISVVLRGQSPLSVSIYYIYLYIECFLLFVGAYLIYNRKRALL
jgi:hypothetical protein